jgi:hypothetical protein
MSSPSDSEAISILECPYGTSRSAWRTARAEAMAAIEKIKVAIKKTKDPRSVQVIAGLDRIVRRIPDAGCALEALADAEDAGAATAALKDQARKTAQLASYYLRSDRLVAMVRDNPYVPVSVDKIFASALQTIQRELK